MKLAQCSIHCCVGIIQKPSRGLAFRQPVWTCQLLLTQCGKSAEAADKCIVSQELLSLKCRGLTIVQHCGSSLAHGDVVHTVAKLIRRPKYMPEHAIYVHDTELLVTDTFGFISILRKG